MAFLPSFIASSFNAFACRRACVSGSVQVSWVLGEREGEGDRARA